MKNIKKKLILAVAAVATVAFCASVMTSCGAFSSMSDQEAYDTGYAIGRTLRYAIDN